MGSTSTATGCSARRVNNPTPEKLACEKWEKFRNESLTFRGGLIVPNSQFLDSASRQENASSDDNERGTVNSGDARFGRYESNGQYAHCKQAPPCFHDSFALCHGLKEASRSVEDDRRSSGTGVRDKGCTRTLAQVRSRVMICSSLCRVPFTVFSSPGLGRNSRSTWHLFSGARSQPWCRDRCMKPLTGGQQLRSVSPVVLCGAAGVKPKSSPRRRRGLGCKHRSRSEQWGKCFA